MLKDKLKEMVAASADKIPPETLAIMQRAKGELAESGIMGKAIKVGDKVADFNLNTANGEQVNLAKLLQNGPVMITIYRGVW